MKCVKCKKDSENLSYCKDCSKEYHKRWYIKNKPAIRKIYSEYSKQYRIKNPEKIKNYSKKYRVENHLKFLNSIKKWRENNPERISKYNKLYKEENKEKEKIWAYARKIRPKIIKQIKSCQNCGNKNNLELHHIKYTNNPEDIKLLCRPCHRRLR